MAISTAISDSAKQSPRRRFEIILYINLLQKTPAGPSAENAAGPLRRRVGFVIDADDADAAGDEAVWRDGKVVGWITSGGYCHHADCSYATGYIPSDTLDGDAVWEIEILGDRRRARLQLEPLFDPTGARARG